MRGRTNSPHTAAHRPRTPRSSPLGAITPPSGRVRPPAGAQHDLFVPIGCRAGLAIWAMQARGIARQAEDSWITPLPHKKLTASEVDMLNASMARSAPLWIATAEAAHIADRPRANCATLRLAFCGLADSTAPPPSVDDAALTSIHVTVSQLPGGSSIDCHDLSLFAFGARSAWV